MDNSEERGSGESSPDGEAANASASEDESMHENAGPDSGDEEVMKEDSDEVSEDEENISAAPKRAARGGGGTNGEFTNTAEESDGGPDTPGSDGEGLFGSGSENEGDENENKPSGRRLDDSELDSGDDEGRNDRAMDVDNPPGVQRELNVMEMNLARHTIPKGDDGELYTLKVPTFLGIEPEAFHNQRFQPPTTDHHSNGPPSEQFSAYNVALNTLRWRRSPRDHQELESNARIIRWSDGSLTLQLASNPLEQFILPASALAPPQQFPDKPTPTSKNKGIRPPPGTKTPYNPQKDAFTFLTSPHEAAGALRITNHITTQLNVLPNSQVKDDAIIRLQESLAAATKGKHKNGEGGVGHIKVTEDPELEKRRAEAAEKDKMRLIRRREAAEARERERNTRILGRSGLGGKAAGLSIGGLEDDEERMALGRKRAAPGSAAKRRARRDDYDSDDEGPRARTKEDEYDKEDGFLADSDEEMEYEGDGADSDEEDVMDDESEEEKKKPKAGKEKVEKEATPVPRGKRRKVIDDDDEDE